MISTSLSQQWIVEYKKFLLLGYLSKEPVGPSADVDEVWHPHQNFTEQHTDFCKDA